LRFGRAIFFRFGFSLDFESLAARSLMFRGVTGGLSFRFNLFLIAFTYGVGFIAAFGSFGILGGFLFLFRCFCFNLDVLRGTFFFYFSLEVLLLLSFYFNGVLCFLPLIAEELRFNLDFALPLPFVLDLLRFA